MWNKLFSVENFDIIISDICFKQIEIKEIDLKVNILNYNSRIYEILLIGNSGTIYKIDGMYKCCKSVIFMVYATKKSNPMQDSDFENRQKIDIFIRIKAPIFK